jgi:predicted Zn-dependent peptidase
MEHTVEEVKLKCGAKGLLIDVPDAPVFCMELWFRAGYNSVANEELRETAHIMEHLACGANEMHATKAEVDRYVSMNGAYSNAWTNTDYLAYVRVCPDFDWERILKQLVVQVTTPKFLEKEFKAEFGNVEEEMQRSSNNKWLELDLKMREKFGWRFSETYPVRLEKMQKVSVEDVREHYKRTHGAENAVFFVAGNISKERDKIIEYLEGLKSLPKTKRFTKQMYPEIEPFSEPVCINKADVPNIYLALDTYFDAIEMEDTKLVANLSVLCRVLSYGDNSRIYGKLRRQRFWILNRDLNLQNYLEKL